MRLTSVFWLTIGLVTLSACASPARIQATAAAVATAVPSSTPTDTAVPPPTATQTPLPLSDLSLWVTLRDDSAAPPVSSFKAGGVSTLYIWAKAPAGVEGDFTLEATYRDGRHEAIGPSFHAATDGETIDCGSWNGSFLRNWGIVMLEAHNGRSLIGRFIFGIY